MDLTNLLTVPSSKFTKTQDCLSFSNIDTQNSLSYAYQSITPQQDFEHHFTFKMSSAVSWAGPMTIWGLSDSPGKIHDLWNRGIRVAVRYENSQYHFELKQQGSGLSSTMLVSGATLYNLNQTYDLTVKRQGNQVSLEVRQGGALKEPVLTATTLITEALDELYLLSSFEGATAGRLMSGQMCSVDIVQSATPPAGLVAPILSLSNAEESVHLTWTAVAGAASYEVLRKQSGDTDWSSWLNVGSVTNKVINNLTANVNYVFAVRAVSSQGIPGVLSDPRTGVPLPSSGPVIEGDVAYVKDVVYNQYG